MAINSTNNSIGFPGLTNNRPGMLMTVPSAAENTKVPEVKVENPVQKPSKEKMSENTKYFIGAAAIAASAIIKAENLPRKKMLNKLSNL